MELWNDYGIVSYNFGGAGNRLPTTYWVLQNLLEYNTPELVVVDCYFLHENNKTPPDALEYVHDALDVFPLTITKYNTINDLWENNDFVNKEQKLEFIWDFSIYHNRWVELNEMDYNKEIFSIEKGAERGIDVAVPSEYSRIDKKKYANDNSYNATYLRKIIEICQEKGIKVLLTYLPYPATAEQQTGANLGYKIANEYNVNYINFLDIDVGVDFDIDCLDAASHLNFSGAKKVTDYLGKYIQKEYSIIDHRGDNQYQSWSNDYELYCTKSLARRLAPDTVFLLFPKIKVAMFRYMFYCCITANTITKHIQTTPLC